METSIFDWHKLELGNDYRSNKFIYTLNVKDIPYGLNRQFVNDANEMTMICQLMMGQDTFTVDKVVVMPMIHSSHWFLTVICHVGTSPVMIILDSMVDSGSTRHQLAFVAISIMYPHLFGTSHTVPITLTCAQLLQPRLVMQ